MASKPPQNVCGPSVSLSPSLSLSLFFFSCNPKGLSASSHYQVLSTLSCLTAVVAPTAWRASEIASIRTAFSYLLALGKKEKKTSFFLLFSSWPSTPGPFGRKGGSTFSASCPFCAGILAVLRLGCPFAFPAIRYLCLRHLFLHVPCCARTPLFLPSVPCSFQPCHVETSAALL